MLINTQNINEAKRKIKEAMQKKERAIVVGQNEDFNRKILEIKGVDTLILGDSLEKDYMKQRNSGLNEILCKIATKNSIKIGINLSFVSKNKKELAINLARLIQNIYLCKKTNTKLIFLGGKDKKALQSLLIILGASTKQALGSVQESF